MSVIEEKPVLDDEFWYSLFLIGRKKRVNAQIDLYRIYSG